MKYTDSLNLTNDLCAGVNVGADLRISTLLENAPKLPTSLIQDGPVHIDMVGSLLGADGTWSFDMDVIDGKLDAYCIAFSESKSSRKSSVDTFSVSFYPTTEELLAQDRTTKLMEVKLTRKHNHIHSSEFRSLSDSEKRDFLRPEILSRTTIYGKNNKLLIEESVQTEKGLQTFIKGKSIHSQVAVGFLPIE